MENKPIRPLDVQNVRDRLTGKSGSQYWRCLEELADTPEFREFLLDEVPQVTRAMDTGMDRRKFLTLAGASLALAGLSGCRWLPQKKIVPYVEQPEDIILGNPMYYASSVIDRGLATGVLVTSREGRPINIAGNPDHPASLGSTSSQIMATLLDLYDSDRSQNVLNGADTSDWDTFLIVLREQIARTDLLPQGDGLRILTETITSPTLANQIKTLIAKYPKAQWHQFEPTARNTVLAGSVQAFGRPVNTIYDFSGAQRILSLDANFLLEMPGGIRYARQFADLRRVRKVAASDSQPANNTMSRLYCIESTPTITGVAADHRLPVKASEVEAFSRFVALQLGVAVDSGAALPASVPADWVAALVDDLKSHTGACVVVPGDEQPPAVHVLAHAMNAALGNVGKTVHYTDPPEANPIDQVDSLRKLSDDITSGQVKILLILGGNPAFTAPADFDFGNKLLHVPLSMHLSTQEDETSEHCKWHLPMSHPLEAWGDALAYDGTASIVQPLIAPLYDTRSANELISAIMGAQQGGYEIVYGYWKQQNPAPDFEKWWQTVLHDGLIKGSALPDVQITLNAASVAAPGAPASKPEQIEIIFRADPTIGDGRWANNGWLQELPKPLTKLTWDNAALMSQATAERLNFAAHNGLTTADEKVVEFTLNGRKLRAPVLVLPGHPDNSVTIHFGYGRTRIGAIGANDLVNGLKKGDTPYFNAYALRASDGMWFSDAMEAPAETTDKPYPLAHTRSHHSMEGRDIVMETTLNDFLTDHPDFAKTDATTNPKDEDGNDLTLYDVQDHAYGLDPNDPKSAEKDYAYEYSWGMSIDNSACIGCNACVTACQSENNIPTVGKDQVQRGREMHWIRIDRYYRGSVGNPHTFFEPVPCMHCENAPCEPVCPVAATVHSQEGLNQMVYNRCVGTRYCSNNCPYKVRRFNFYKYTAGQPDPDKMNGSFDSPVLRLIANPEVTVRGRGVMEKCTYCVQRINKARISAKKDVRAIKEGEIVTACQQACPTNAIVFGNVADPKSEVSLLKKQPHDYSLLADLNTHPRTTYLGKLRNPNPAIPEDNVPRKDPDGKEIPDMEDTPAEFGPGW